MSITTEVFDVISIDKLGTERREDSFYIDERTGDIRICSIVPDFSKSDFGLVASAIRNHKPIKKPSQFFFDKEEKGFIEGIPTSCFCVHASSPYETFTVGLGKALLVKAYSYEEAEHLKETDTQIRLLYEYADGCEYIPQTAAELVSFLIRKFNKTIQLAMMQEQVPFFSHRTEFNQHHNETTMISMSGGTLRLNRPFRDAVSYMNSAQLLHWLQHGTPAFSYSQMADMIKR